MKVRVRCSNGKEYSSIRSAAIDAEADNWTMSYKMATAGGFIDKNGNEYTRIDPANFSREYPNTGKTLKHRGPHGKRAIRENRQPELGLPDPVRVVEEPLDFDIIGGNDEFTMTIKGMSAKRLAKVIILLTKEA